MVKGVIADPFWYLFLSKYFANFSCKVVRLKGVGAEEH